MVQFVHHANYFVNVEVDKDSIFDSTKFKFTPYCNCINSLLKGIAILCAKKKKTFGKILLEYSISFYDPSSCQLSFLPSNIDPRKRYTVIKGRFCKILEILVHVELTSKVITKNILSPFFFFVRVAISELSLATYKDNKWCLHSPA